MAESQATQAKDEAAEIDDDRLAAYAREFTPGLIRNFMKRGAQEATAQDLAQDVFERLAKRASGDELKNPQAYIMQTASSVWTDHLRKCSVRHHREHDEYEDHRHAPKGFSPERVLEGKEALDAIQTALNELPERTRDIYVLCRIEGLKRQDVANRFAMTINGVDWHLIRASAHVATAFGDME